MHRVRLSRRLCLSAASFVALISFATFAAVAAPLRDGPYVLGQPNGTFIAQSIEEGDSGPRVRRERISLGQYSVVPAVGSLPAFKVRVRPPAPIAADGVSLPPETPLFVVADTHGEYEIFGELLKNHGIVDASLKWSFGRGHLVILGDVFDRGPNQIEILWLLYALEAQAAKAGGGVHLVLGNHEAMVLTGDLRYLNPKYTRTAEVLGAASYSELIGPQTLLGQWLRTKPAVLKIKDLLCLHGGISRGIVTRKLTIQSINATVREALDDAPATEPDELTEFVMGRLGPLWYRGYFAEQKDFPTATSDDIDAIARHFGVRAILVGHTTVPTVTSLHGGRVIAVQVYPRRDEKSGQFIMEALRIDADRFLRAVIDGGLEPLANSF